MRGKCGQDFSLLPLGHVEVVKRSRKLGRDFVEDVGRDLQSPMGFLQADVSLARLRGCIDLGAARNLISDLSMLCCNVSVGAGFVNNPNLAEFTGCGEI